MLVKLKDREGNLTTQDLDDTIRFMHLNARRSDCGGVTVLCREGEEQDEYAFAFCSPNDNYDRARGRFEVLEKLNQSDPDELFDYPTYDLIKRPIGVLCPETYPERFQSWLVTQIMKQAARCRARAWEGQLICVLAQHFPDACEHWLKRHRLPREAQPAVLAMQMTNALLGLVAADLRLSRPMANPRCPMCGQACRDGQSLARDESGHFAHAACDPRILHHFWARPEGRDFVALTDSVPVSEPLAAPAGRGTIQPWPTAGHRGTTTPLTTQPDRIVQGDAGHTSP